MQSVIGVFLQANEYEGAAHLVIIENCHRREKWFILLFLLQLCFHDPNFAFSIIDICREISEERPPLPWIVLRFLCFMGERSQGCVNLIQVTSCQ